MTRILHHILRDFSLTSNASGLQGEVPTEESAEARIPKEWRLAPRTTHVSRIPRKAGGTAD